MNVRQVQHKLKWTLPQQPTLAEKFAAVWEKKNAKAVRAGGISNGSVVSGLWNMMVLQLLLLRLQLLTRQY